MPKNNKKPVTKRGGSEKRLKDGKARLIYLDSPTTGIVSTIGDGNLSRGIRIAALIVSILPGPERTALIIKAHKIEAERAQEIRDTLRESS